MADLLSRFGGSPALAKARPRGSQADDRPLPIFYVYDSYRRVRLLLTLG